MVVMMEGATEASGQQVSHLQTIKKSMQPNRSIIKTSWGINSKKNQIALPKQMVFDAFTKTPRVIWITPMMTEIFILRELTKLRLFYAIDQAGSRPKGQTQSGVSGSGFPASTPSTEQHDPKRFKLVETQSLQINPQYVAKNPIKVSIYR